MATEGNRDFNLEWHAWGFWWGVWSIGIFNFVFGFSADEQRKIEQRLKLYDDARKQLLDEGADPREAAVEAFTKARWTKLQ
jgi:hypothetical protein